MYSEGGGQGRGRSHRRQGGAHGGGPSRGPSRGRPSRDRGKQGGRQQGKNEKKTIDRFGFRNLQSMLEKDPDTLVLDMASERCLPATQNLVQEDNMDNEKLILVLKVFSRATECRTTQSMMMKLLSVLPKSMFLNKHLVNYLVEIANADVSEIEDREETLMMAIRLLTNVLQAFPSSYTDLPIQHLYMAVTIFNSKGELFNTNILSEMDGLCALKNEKRDKILEEKEKKPKKSKEKKYGNDETEQPPEDFRTLSIVPTQEDILSQENPFLKRNKVKDRYDNTMHYLDTQFRLLREDFFRPLREGISDILSKKQGFLQDIRVYHKVQILYPVHTSKGLTYKVSFDVSRFSKTMRWENSKRLIYGSLLCLSKDNFQTVFLATVENRDVKELKQGKIEIKFTDISKKIELDKSMYDMVETTAYFEAYRHVLEGLQEIDINACPFQRYIVDCERDVQPPAYLRNRNREEVTYDLSPIMKTDLNATLGTFQRLSLHQSTNGEAVRILKTNMWPSADDLQLDDSQLKAVQLALTKEFALIQGPPGTGKTYIGLKVVRVLLHNKKKWMSGTENDMEEQHPPVRGNRTPVTHPILVVCYTNHALDQFLEGIHDFHPKGIVRIGGRSQSEVMKACSLREHKFQLRKDKKAPREISRSFSEIRSQLNSTSEHLRLATENMRKCSEQLIHENMLYRRQYISTEHYNQLTIDHNTGQRIDNAIGYWLGLLNNDPFKSSIAVPPISLFPLNEALRKKNAVNPEHEAKLYNVNIAAGLDGRRGGSHQLQGAHNSYIFIPNRTDGFLDTRQSITILLFVYPMSLQPAPIICFNGSSKQTGIEIRVNGMIDDRGLLEVVFTSRDGVQVLPALSRPVLIINQWNYIAASYDYETGVYSLWHQGRLVQQKQNLFQMEIATHLPVFIGSRYKSNRNDTRNNRNEDNMFFEGRVCGVHFFPAAIGRQQILAIAGIHEEDLTDDYEELAAQQHEEQEEPDNDTLFEAKAVEELRMLDTDDVTRFVGMTGKTTIQTINLSGKSHSNQCEWQVQGRKKSNSRMQKNIARELSTNDMMSSQQANHVTNLWALSPKDRWRLYRYWIDQLCEEYRQIIDSDQKEFELGAKRLREVQSLEDQYILKNASVIGMTTTGAAKFRHLIQVIKPRITIVEEAAEVLESHIVTSLSPECQHLILIGDHKQLRPNPTVYSLAKDYNLDVSLFERMFNNGLRLERLNAQHRMRPEIAELMAHIYDGLQNHKSVLDFDNIKGVDKNIFFIDHCEPEDFIEEGRSRSNEHEAKYLSSLCRYLILQGYEREQITILTMYTGQLIQLKKHMPRDFFNGVRVCAVDNFQGEENDIILLSLVRSNEDGNIGFLKIQNRVCVALSRAKKGFYCIGNLALMSEKESLWSNIVKDMYSKGKVGEYLTLTCQNHPKNIIHASTPEDFRKAPEGGCTEPCATRLKCGHVCKSACHPGDPEHEKYKCKENCTKMLCKDHKCPKSCWQDCGKCTVRVIKEMPNCYHQQQMPCYKSPLEFDCQAPCASLLSCGHNCSRKCSERCEIKCLVKVPKTLNCDHVNQVACHEKVDNVECKAPCGEILSCGHQCKGTCSECFRGRVHVPCKAKCDRQLFCGHICKEPCTKNCPSCSQPCQNKCVHSKCKNKCGQPCVPCQMPCAWKCQHYKCTRLCGEPCNRPRCPHPCTKKLRCGHECIGMCGEPCPSKCRVCNKDEVEDILFGDEDEPNARFVQLEPCGHVIEVNAMDYYMDGDVDDSIQLKGCPRCKTPIRTALRYADIIKKTLNDFEKVKTKLIVDDYKLQLEKKRLNDKLTSQTFHQTLKPNVQDILTSLSGKSITDEQLNMYENQINFLCFLSSVMIGLKRHRETSGFRFMYVVNMCSQMIEQSSEKLKQRIVKQRSRFSDQEKEEINDELLRFSLVSNLLVFNEQRKVKSLKLNGVHEKRLDIISNAIQSERRIDKRDIKRYMDILQDLSRRYGLEVFYQDVTEKEKEMIVKAMGMQQGHWFKCPKGHVYCIGECGGAMEEAKCPECGSQIGGTSHTLRGDNALAGEMDGARHAAWSDHTNNMRNFNLDEDW